MIDTLKIYTDDFRVRDNANLQIQPAPLDYETNTQNERKLFRNSAGEWVEGAKAFLNTERYNLTIKPDNAGEGVKVYLQWSLPKAFTGDNFYPLADDQIAAAKQALEDELRDKGIMLELNECKLSRVDAFRNAYTDEGFSDYAALFRLLRAKRQQRRDYGTTFLWANTQREICVYDKIAEAANRGVSTAGYPQRTTRFEYRLLNNRVTQKETGLSKLADLQDFEGVKVAYKQALEKNLFSLTVEDAKALVGSEIEKILRSYQATGGLRWLDSGVDDLAYYGLLRAVELDTLRDVLKNLQVERTTAWRLIKKLEQANLRLAMHLDGVNGKTLAELYNELREKVLNEN